jgi:hypothetical protein
MKYKNKNKIKAERTKDLRKEAQIGNSQVNKDERKTTESNSPNVFRKFILWSSALFVIFTDQLCYESEFWN